MIHSYGSTATCRGSSIGCSKIFAVFESFVSFSSEDTDLDNVKALLKSSRDQLLIGLSDENEAIRSES